MITRRTVLALPALFALPVCPYYPPIIVKTKSGWVFDYANRIIIVGDTRQDFFEALQRELRAK